MTDLDSALEAWYDEIEADLVRQAIEMVRVYQFKMPDGIGPFRRGPWPSYWWDAFWDRLEGEVVLEQRPEYIRRWMERNAPGGYQTRLADVFRVDHERHRYIVAGQVDLALYADGGVLSDG